MKTMTGRYNDLVEMKLKQDTLLKDITSEGSDIEQYKLRTNKKLQQLHDEINEAEKEKEDIAISKDSQIQELSIKDKQSTEKIRYLEAEVEDLSSQLSTIKQEMTNLTNPTIKRALDTEIKKLQEKHNNEIESLKSEIESQHQLEQSQLHNTFERQVSDQSRIIEDLSNRLKMTESKFNTLRDEAKQLQQNESTYKNKLSENENIINNYGNKISELQSQLDNFKTSKIQQSNMLKNNGYSININVKSLKTCCENIKSTIKQQTDFFNKELNPEGTFYKSLIQLFETVYIIINIFILFKLQKHKQIKQDYSIQLDGVKKQLQNTEYENKILKNQLQDTTQKNEEVIKNLTNDLKEIQQKSEEVKNDLVKKEYELKGVSEEKNKLSNNVEELKSKIQKIDTEKSELTEKVEKQNKEIEELSDNVKAIEDEKYI